MRLERRMFGKKILSCVLAMTLIFGIIPAFQVAAADQTVTIRDHVNNSTNAGNSGVAGFYFSTDGDELDYAEDWSVRYGKEQLVSGGITVEGAEISEDSGESDNIQNDGMSLPIQGADLVSNTTIASTDGSMALTAVASSMLTDGVDCGDVGVEVKEWLISLPKINYEDYETVSMSFKGSADWQAFGFSVSNRVSDGGSGVLEGTITITNNGDGTLKGVISASSHNQSVEETITDAEIVNGTKALTLSWNNGAAYRHMHIGPITGEPKSASQTGVSEGSHLVSNTTIASEDGSMALTAAASSMLTDGVDCGDVGVEVKEWLISLPKINYTNYETVSMSFKGSDAWQSFGFSVANRVSDGGSGVLEGTITITNNGDGTLKGVISASSHNQSVEETITDAEIINGTKELTLSWNNGAAYRHMHIGPITGVLKEGAGDAGSEQETPVVTMLKTDASTYFVDLYVAGVTPISGTKVTIEGTYTDGVDNVTFRKAVFGFDGTKWVLEEAEQAPIPDAVLATIADHEYNATNAGNSGATGFYFSTGSDPLDYAEDWSVRYGEGQLVSGGIYIEPDVDSLAAGADYACVENVKRMVELPCIDYSSYELVCFTWFTTGWTQAGYGDDLWFYNGGTALSGSVSIANKGENTLELTMEETGSGQGTHTVTIADADIYTGAKALALAANNLVGTQTMALGEIQGFAGLADEDVTITMLKVDAGTYFVDLAAAEIVSTKDMKIVIEGTWFDGTDAVELEKASFVYDGTKWALEGGTQTPDAKPDEDPDDDSKDEPVDLSKHKYTTVTIKIHENNLAGFGGAGVNGFYFRTNDDPLAYKDDWTVRYVKPASGGVYVNGKLTEVQLIKYASGEYFAALLDSGFTATAGMQIVIDGAFYDTEDVVTFKKATFTFDGSVWQTETVKEEVDLSKYEKKTVTIKEHENNLAGFGGAGVNGFYFRTENDPLAYKDDWSVRYTEAAKGGVYVNSELKLVQLIKYASGEYYVGLVDSGFTATKGMQVVIEGTYVDSTYAVTFKKATFTFDGSKWTFDGEKEVVDISKHKKTTVKVLDHDMNLGNSGTNGFYFKTEEDPLAYGTDWMTRYFVPAKGGIYLDGELKTVQLIKFGEGEYFVGLLDSGLDVLVKKGSEVTIDGTFFDSKHAVTFEKATFVFDGHFWMMKQEGADVEVQDMEDVTTYDLYEFTKTLSAPVNRKECKVIGSLDSFRNTSLKMKVNINADAWELLFGLGKDSTNNMWLGDGYQIVIQPSKDLILIRCDISTNVAAGYYEIPEEFVLEIGTRDVATMDGAYYGTRVFVLINGEEVVSWVDSNTTRVMGRNIMYYAPDTVNATLWTARDLTMLATSYEVDGQAKDSYELVTPSPVMLGEKNYYVVKKSSSQDVCVKNVALLLNGKKAKLVAENAFSYTFLIEPVKDTDTMTIQIDTAKRTVDAPTEVLDFFDVAGTRESNSLVLGHLIGNGEAMKTNMAMQFAIQLPADYKESAIAICADHGEIFRTKGYTILFSPDGVSIRHGSTHTELAFGSSELFRKGAKVYVECGIVKCYENDVYKYDSIYVKAGNSPEEMEMVVWYDSTRRGGYDSGVVSNGTATICSVKSIYTLTDVSAEKQEVYFSHYVVSGGQATIVLHTKQGTSVASMTVDGKKLEPKSVEDGVYIYEIQAITGDRTFKYTIKED